MTFSLRTPVPPACPEDLTELEAWPTNLHCPRCGRDFARVEGIYDLLPREAPSGSSAQGAELRRYQASFAERRDRAWYQPLRLLTGSLANGYLYAWAARSVEAFAGSRALALLDAGCGDGMLRYYLSVRHVYVGVDFAMRMLARARRYRPATYFRADLNRLPFPNESFDAIVSLQALQYLDRPEVALAEMARVLKPRGRLFLSLPNHQSFKYRWQGISSTQVQHFNLASATALVSREFDCLESSVRGFWVPLPHIPIHVGMQMPINQGVALTIIATPKK